MTNPGKRILTALSLASLLAVAACSSDSTSPTPTTPTTTAATITSISPSTATASATTQTFTVTGTGFTSGMSFILKGPDTGATLYGPSSITNLTSTSFQVGVILNVSGNWTATARLADGTDSAQFAFTVAAAPSNSSPQISATSPASVVNGPDAQTISIAGANFRAGLSLIVKDPSGASLTYSNGAITSQTSTSFSALVTLVTAGSYQLTVKNSDGTQSAAFTMVVNARPTVTAVAPTSLVASSSAQTITVTGMNFSSNLTYVVNGPGTGATLHGVADVTNISSNSFSGPAVFNVAGDWSVTVINSNGVSSAQFFFRVN